MTSPTTKMTGQVAIAGHRSFIAKQLARELELAGTPAEPMDKSSLGVRDMSDLYCVYLVLGRAKPRPADETEEMGQLAAFLSNPNPPRRAVYISSLVQTNAKKWCERQIREHNERTSKSPRVFVIRPAAVFGPDQDLDSDMLIPSIARSEGVLQLRTPDSMTEFISVGDLTRHLARFAQQGWTDHLWAGDPASIFSVPGTFTATPHQIRELYKAFKGLEHQRIWSGDR